MMITNSDQNPESIIKWVSDYDFCDFLNLVANSIAKLLRDQISTFID